MEVERRVEVAVSGERAEKVSLEGRTDRMSEERMEGGRERRLRLKETVWVDLDGLEFNRRVSEKDTKKWSDTWRGVTVVLVMLESRENMRSRDPPALWVEGRRVGVRSKDCSRETTVFSWEESGRLKSPSRTTGVPSSGKALRRMSNSSGKWFRGPGGR